MFSRSRITTSDQPLPPVLLQLQAELQEAAEAEYRPTWRSRVRSFLWRRRRSHGVPLMVAVGVWAVGQWIRYVDIGPFWVALAGWVFVLAVWFRARAQYLAHTLACAIFIATWLFLVALDA